MAGAKNHDYHILPPDIWPLIGAIYGVAALILSVLFVALSLPVALRRARDEDRMKPEKRLFSFSVLYLFALFTALVADRMILA